MVPDLVYLVELTFLEGEGAGQIPIPVGFFLKKNICVLTMNSHSDQVPDRVVGIIWQIWLTKAILAVHGVGVEEARIGQLCSEKNS